MKFFVMILTSVVLAACTSIRPVPLTEILNLPIVQVGDPLPQEGEFVVFFPKDTYIPVILNANGSLFSSEVQLNGKVKLSRDLYLYKSWGSHDGIHWENSHKLIDVTFGGGFDVEGLKSNITLAAN